MSYVGPGGGTTSVCFSVKPRACSGDLTPIAGMSIDSGFEAGRTGPTTCGPIPDADGPPGITALADVDPVEPAADGGGSGAFRWLTKATASVVAPVAARTQVVNASTRLRP